MWAGAMDDPGAVLTPHLSSLWLGLVTPIYARVGRKLIESMRNQTLVSDRSALTTFGIKPKGLSEAIERALHHESRDFALTSWSDALSPVGRRHRGVMCGLERDWWIPGPYRYAFHRPSLLPRSSGLEARPDGTSPVSCGKFEASSIFLWAAWDCAGAAGILIRWPLAMLWTSGGWRALNRIAGST
jgi:hypothetical protein